MPCMDAVQFTYLFIFDGLSYFQVMQLVNSNFGVMNKVAIHIFEQVFVQAVFNSITLNSGCRFLDTLLTKLWSAELLTKDY